MEVIHFVMCVFAFCTLIIGPVLSFPQAKSTSVFAFHNIISTAPKRSENNQNDSTNYEANNGNTTDAFDIKSSEEYKKRQNDSNEYSYEIELDSGEAVERKKLCKEESMGRHVYLYDTKERRCSIIGEKGHCGKNMVFRPEINSTIYGYCECDFGKSKAPLVFHNKTDTCYSIYTQAYCAKNEWLILDKENGAICVTSLCDNGRKNKSLKVPLNGTGPCVKLNSVSSHCSKEEIVQFELNRAIPTCGYPIKRPSPRLLSPVTQFNCQPGSFMSYSGKCQSNWFW